MSTLTTASNQWANRPDDQRFTTVEALHDYCCAVRAQAASATVDLGALRAVPSADGAELSIVGPAGRPAELTHWGFGQLAQRLRAPADYLRRLPAPLAAENVNHGFAELAADDRSANLLLHANGALRCRAFLSDRYSRIWGADITPVLLRLAETGWRVPPARPARADQPGARPATSADILADQSDFGLSVREGDIIAPAGLYASDQDLFAFMVRPGDRIDDGSELGLARGFFVENSEVGAAAFKLTTFLYRAVCGNHIVWGASNVAELRVIHTGAADQRWRGELVDAVRAYAASSLADDRERLAAAQRFSIADDRAGVIDALYTRQIAARKTLDAAYELAEQQSAETGAGSPRSAWGFAQGLTALSQSMPNADRRTALDRAAGRVLAMAF